MEIDELKKTIEALLFITDQPLSMARLKAILGVKNEEQILAAIHDIQREYEERGSAVHVLEIAEGFQMATRPAQASFIRKLYSERMTMRLSAAALETLSIIAYKQPLTRAEIEEIRGVEVIAALETLLDKRLIKVVGRKESVGRPLLYGTSPEFLRHFGLKDLEQMPPLDSYQPPEPQPAAGAPATQSTEEMAPVTQTHDVTASASIVAEPSAESDAALVAAEEGPASFSDESKTETEPAGSEES